MAIFQNTLLDSFFFSIYNYYIGEDVCSDIELHD